MNTNINNTEELIEVEYQSEVIEPDFEYISETVLTKEETIEFFKTLGLIKECA